MQACCFIKRLLFDLLFVRVIVLIQNKSFPKYKGHWPIWLEVGPLLGILPVFASFSYK